ncbi:hypothetical protein DFH07DRAFT_941547 [Mycena maculata]|uniref:BTB domain-containing protein n=1 Tax=Mycena maculata TaxID=230809 RepID=A0AAD7N901_9AGAR|nr:hypothetical protein DFH07DRAFT_941547 [Mycena maculata]
MSAKVSPSSEPQRCPDLWFADCGLIVRAGNVLFRVSREMLGARSPVFADMLSFPQPDDAERIEDCPVVDLPDTAREVEVFFKALFNHDFFKPHPAKTDYPTIEGVLRLSNKYEVDSLRKRALIHLGSCFAGERHTALMESSWSPSRVHLPSIIILCREVSALWILPTVFRTYAQLYDYRDILRGHTSFDGRRILLGQKDQLAVLTGALALRTRKTSEFWDFIWYPEEIEGCASVLGCLAARNRLRRSVEKAQRGRFPDDIVIHPDKLKTCRVCKAALQKSYQLAKKKLNQSMPEIFGLPDWKTLNAMEASALE